MKKSGESKGLSTAAVVIAFPGKNQRGDTSLNNLTTSSSREATNEKDALKAYLNHADRLKW